MIGDDAVSVFREIRKQGLIATAIFIAPLTARRNLSITSAFPELGCVLLLEAVPG